MIIHAIIKLLLYRSVAFLRNHAPRRCSLIVSPILAAHGGILADLLSVHTHISIVVATSRLHELFGRCVIGAPIDRGGPGSPGRAPATT